VCAEGVSYTIAEEAEQLAWLFTALQDAETEKTQTIKYSRPCIAHGNAGVWKIRTEQTSGPASKTESLFTLERLGWLGNVINPVIAQGFPTIRCPSFATDLEVSPEVMASLVVPMRNRSSEDWWVHVLRTDQILELVEQKQGACLWHVVTAGAKRCQCGRGIEAVGSKEIRQYRHFLGSCPDPKHLSSKLDPTAQCLEQSQTRDCELDNLASSIACPTPETPWPNSDCTTTSLESDIMSVPESLATPLRDFPDWVSPVLDVVACQLVLEYQSGSWQATHESLQGDKTETAFNVGAETVQDRPQSEASQDGNPVSVTREASSSTTNQGSQKAPRAKRKGADCRGHEGEDDNDEEENKRPPKRPRPKHGLPLNKPLACPYLKLDPIKHNRCLRMNKLLGVNRVKQHLARSHREPEFFCDRCKTIFREKAAHEHHLKEAGAACVFKTWGWGHRPITRTQEKELHKNSKPYATEPERWFAIWKILFPDDAPPTSPFLDLGFSDDLYLFWEYGRRRGRTILLEELRAAQPVHTDAPLSEEASESFTLEAIDRAFTAMIQDFTSSRAFGNRSPVRSGSSGTALSRQETPLGSFTDSGVEVNN